MGAPRDDLRILAIFHWVLAGLAAVGTAIPLLYVGMGVFFLHGKFDGQAPPPEFVGWFMIVFGAAFATMALGYAALVAYAGRCLARTRHWTFVVVVAGLSCAFFPFGTVLGVFTIVVLSKFEVKALFQPPTTAGAAPPLS